MNPTHTIPAPARSGFRSLMGSLFGSSSIEFEPTPLYTSSETTTYAPTAPAFTARRRYVKRPHHSLKHPFNRLNAAGDAVVIPPALVKQHSQVCAWRYAKDHGFSYKTRTIPEGLLVIRTS